MNVYCKNCKQNVNKESYGFGWGVLTVLGLLFWLIPGIIILLWRLNAQNKCPICKGQNFKEC